VPVMRLLSPGARHSVIPAGVIAPVNVVRHCRDDGIPYRCPGGYDKRVGEPAGVVHGGGSLDDFRTFTLTSILAFLP
jgi:hypothetical protein